jgi:hypothetical protein
MVRSLWQRLASFRRPDGPAVGEPPAVGEAAPTRPRLAAGEPRVVLFLRHTGCAFGEHMLEEFRATAREHPDVQFVAITHGDPDAATAWCESLGLERVTVSNAAAEDAVDQWCRDPEADNLRVLVDEDRELYAEWGLGLGGLRHLLRPTVVRNLLRALRSGAKDRTPSGTRWQRAGMFGVDPDGTVRTRYIADYAGDLPDIEVAPSFLDHETESGPAVRNVTAGSGTESATDTEPSSTATDDTESATTTPRSVEMAAEPAVTRAPPEPRTTTDEATAAVHRVESASAESGSVEPTEPTSDDTDPDTEDGERQRLRTDGG